MPGQQLSLHVHPDSLPPDVREALGHCPHVSLVTGSRPLPIDGPQTFQGIVVLSGRAGGDVAPELVGELAGYVGRDTPFLLAAADQGVMRAAIEVVATLAAAVAGRA